MADQWLVTLERAPRSATETPFRATVITHLHPAEFLQERNDHSDIYRYALIFAMPLPPEKPHPE